jgi:hypothetical protein
MLKLGPKLTVITKYGAKATLRFSFFVWVLNREFSDWVKDKAYSPWEEADTLTFTSRTNSNITTIRTTKEDCVSIKLSWF